MKKCLLILAIIMLAFSNITLSQAVVNITAPTAGYNWIATVTPTLVINFNLVGNATVNINVNPNVQNIIINNTTPLTGGDMTINFTAGTSVVQSIKNTSTGVGNIIVNFITPTSVPQGFINNNASLLAVGTSMTLNFQAATSIVQDFAINNTSSISANTIVNFYGTTSSVPQDFIINNNSSGLANITFNFNAITSMLRDFIINNNCTATGNTTVNFVANTTIARHVLMVNSAQAASNLTVKGPGIINILGDLLINSPGNVSANQCEFINTSYTNIFGNVVLGSASPLINDGSSVIGKGTGTTSATKTYNLYGNLTVNARGSVSYPTTIFNFNKPSGTPQYIYNNTALVSTFPYPVTFEDIRVGTANTLPTTQPTIANATNLIFSGTNKNAYLDNRTVVAGAGITIGGTLDLPYGYSLNTLNTLIGTLAKINLKMYGGSKLRIGGDQTDPSSAAPGIFGSNFPNILDKNPTLTKRGIYNLDPSSTIEYYGSSAITQTIYSLPYNPLTALPNNTQYAILVANNDGGTGTGRAKKITTAPVIVDTRLDIKTNTDVTLGTANNLNDCPLYTVGPIKVQAGTGPRSTNGGGLYCNANVVSGSFTLANTITTGTFALDDYAYLGMGHALGISPTGTLTGNIQMANPPIGPSISFPITGNYIYNGIVPQITGTGLPTDLISTSPTFGLKVVNDLTIDNATTPTPTTAPYSVTIANNQIVNGVCLLAKGIFDIGTNKLTSNGLGKISRTISLIPAVEGTGQMKADAFVTTTVSTNPLVQTTVAATVEMRGNELDPLFFYIAQNLTGSWFVGNTIATLIDANKKGINIANTPTSPLQIAYSLEYGKDEAGVDITSSTINTNNSVTLLSRAAGTANFGVKTATNVITGTVSIERFLPQLNSSGGTTKAWRVLATPVVIATSPTITDSWREGTGGVPGQTATPTGYGTRITGPNGIGNAGVDEYTIRGSLKYVNSTNTFTEISNTALNIANEQGYFVFVRGDRSVPVGGTLGSTILRIKGEVRTGNQNFTVLGTGSGSGGNTSIGNPYPSRIKFGTILKSGIVDGFTAWNPNNIGSYNAGAYENYSKQGLNYVNGAGNIRNEIESGEAIFLQNNVPVAGSFTVQETDKGVGSNVVSRINILPTIWVKMNSTYLNDASLATSYAADGVYINYNAGFIIGIDNDDMRKYNNTKDNLAVANAGFYLAADRRPFTPVMDSIQLNITGMREALYSFDITPSLSASFTALGLLATLKDNYLNTETPIRFNDLPTSYKFKVILADAASYAANRFKIVFSQSPIVIAEGRSATTNTALAKIENVNTATETTTAKQVEMEAALKETISNKTDIFIQPNPIMNGIVNVRFDNNKTGKYTVQITNQLGQVIKTETLQVQTNKDLHNINIGTVGKGTYQAIFIDELGNKTTVGFVVQ